MDIAQSVIKIQEVILELKAVQHYLGYPDEMANAIEVIESIDEERIRLWNEVRDLKASLTVEKAALDWHEGEPPRPWRDEWFIAKTIRGDRVVLRSLPEDWTYDYTTADETYIMAKNIRCWMQFPDSQFNPYVSA